MFAKIRSRLSYANVMATIAVFGLLGGASYAAVNLPKNSVGPSQIEKNAVRAPEIGANAVRAAEIGENAVGTGKVLDGSLLCQDFAQGQPVCRPDEAAAPPPAPPAGPTGVTSFSVRRGNTVTNSGGIALPMTSTAPCNPGEQATGGGYQGPPPGTDRPEPDTGTPTAWTVNALVPDGGSLTAYVVCAS